MKDTKLKTANNNPVLTLREIFYKNREESRKSIRPLVNILKKKPSSKQSAKSTDAEV